MFARVKRIDSLNLYVSGVIFFGALCTAALFVFDAGELHLVLTPEIGLFMLCALVGDFVPLKVFTRGAEGEITTSTCFAVAAMLAAGPLAALLALIGTNLIADGIRRKPFRKVAFNLSQYAITVAASAAALRLTTGLPRTSAPHLVPGDLPGVLVAVGVFFVVNTALVAAVIALVQRTSILRNLGHDLAHQATTV